ncbi:MAG: biopolymer transporter ExbD [Verrucomicrobiae bacterium]|nr:biopolymer transporter ExbD [Verrucomicrobiae bacterium]
MAIKRASQSAFPEEEPEFQVAPMIDVLLVLMTFFMSITSTEILRTKTKLDLELPVARESKPKDTAPREIIINVTWAAVRHEGFLEIEENVIGVGQLAPLIQQRRGRDEGFYRAVIRADSNVPYSFLQQVLSACADANVDNITFSVLSQEAPKGYTKPSR